MRNGRWGSKPQGARTPLALFEGSMEVIGS